VSGDRPKRTVRTRVWRVDERGLRLQSDRVVTEEPLELRLSAGGETRSVAVTMRTPGSDFELSAGFLFGEGVVRSRDEIARLSYCLGEEQRYNVVNAELRAEALPALDALERHFTVTSACGVCGKASLEALALRGCKPLQGGPRVTFDTLRRLPETLREAQGLFEATGGLHAAALFTPAGELVAVREDVGRHNALDKLIGWALLESRLPLSGHLALLSGRASYELLQKALVAGIPIVCAVSAPSSLAVALAERFGITLIGFLREGRFNVYSHPERVLAHASDEACPRRPGRVR
jgi:FdhD protein